MSARINIKTDQSANEQRQFCRHIGNKLTQAYADLVDSPLPDRLNQLLEELDEGEPNDVPAGGGPGIRNDRLPRMMHSAFH
jgi:hypothetical protein